MAHPGIAQQDQIGQPPGLGRAGALHRVMRWRLSGRAAQEQAVGLTRAEGGPARLIGLCDIEDDIMVALQGVQRLGRRELGDHGAAEAEHPGVLADPLHEGADRPGASRDEAEHRRAAGRLALAAQAADHQPSQLDGQFRPILERRQEDIAPERQHLAVAQRHHGGGVRRAGQDGDFAGRFARLDQADEARRRAFLRRLEHAQAAASQQIDSVGGLAGGDQGLAAGHRQPAGLAPTRALEDLGQGGF